MPSDVILQNPLPHFLIFLLVHPVNIPKRRQSRQYHSHSQLKQRQDLGKKQKGPSSTKDLISPTTVPWSSLEINLQVCAFNLHPFINVVPHDHQQAPWFTLFFRGACQSLHAVEPLLVFWVNVLSNSSSCMS